MKANAPWKQEAAGERPAWEGGGPYTTSQNRRHPKWNAGGASATGRETRDTLCVQVRITLRKQRQGAALQNGF